MIKITRLSKTNLALLNGLVIGFSVLLCALLMPTRWPGMELASIAPNWLMMWVVAWSVKRSIWEGLIAGVVLGAIQDGLIGSHLSSHIFSLVAVGVLTALLQKQRYTQEEIVSPAMITFCMTGIAEAVMAVQYILQAHTNFADVANSPIWQRYEQVALASAILSSLWMPVLYYPLNYWWEKIQIVED
jgi:rod shape-determining protein MreD